MIAPLRLLVGEEAEGERLDKFLAEETEAHLSRERLKRLVRDGQVRVNGQPQSKASLRLKEGDEVLLAVPDAVPMSLPATGIPLEIVFEDTDLLVVNKPVGMLTHPTGRMQTDTLVNALLAHCGISLSGINGVLRPGIVHRLDRDTSGLLVVAKSDRAHLSLSAQLKEKSARREYRAIAQGKFPKNEGTVDAPIDRNPKQRDKMMIDPAGRPAVTHWRVTDRVFDKFARLELRLETGRTHQIRLHMAHIGHPLVGDPLYGSGIDKVLNLQSLHIRGQLLQAFRLSFRHPATEESVCFEIPVSPEIERTWAFLQERG